MLQSEIKLSSQLKLFISKIVENVLDRVINPDMSGGYRTLVSSFFHVWVYVPNLMKTWELAGRAYC